MVRPVSLLLLASLLLAPGCASSQAARGAGPTPGDGPAPLVQYRPLSFSPLVRRVVPAVVAIEVTETVPEGADHMPVPPALRGTPFERRFRDRMRNRSEQMIGAGSGFIIDPSGVIVTNNHVVAGADRIEVSLSDGTELPAKLIGADQLTDLAVLQVRSPKPLPYVTWGDSRAVQVGDWVLAAGNPFGLGSSVTAGIVSARGRDIGAGPFDDFLQLDAPINPGNSGGPSFNMSGQVIAINTAIVSPTGGSVGIGFAIPSELVEPIVAELRAKGHIDRGWLGVSVQDVPGPHQGVPIESLEPHGPAAASGLRRGDVITAVNGSPVGSARGLIRDVARAGPGTSVRLDVDRDGHALHIPVVVGLRPASGTD